MTRWPNGHEDQNDCHLNSSAFSVEIRCLNGKGIGSKEAKDGRMEMIAPP